MKKGLNKLYIDKIDETISEEFYFEKKNEWQIELDKLRMQFDYASQENDEIIQRASLILTLCKNAYSAYLSGDVLQKRTLLKLVPSHFLWDGENLTIKIKNTLKPMFKCMFFQNGGLGETRTLDQLIKSQLLYQLSYKPMRVNHTLLKNFFQDILFNC